MAGRFSGDVSVVIPGVSLAGSLDVRISTITADVHETFVINTVETELILPQGPYLKVEGKDLTSLLAV